MRLLCALPHSRVLAASATLPLPRLRSRAELPPHVPLHPPSAPASVSASFPAQAIPGGGRFGFVAGGGLPASLVAMAAAAAPAPSVPETAPPAEVLVKAATGHPDQLGDCPFSQRVLITLEEKGIPYSVKLVDTANKPQWFLEANPEGKVPVYKRKGAWLADSDAIVQALEEDYPGTTKLAVDPEKAQLGGSLFGAFARFLKGGGSEEDLLAQLKALDQALAKSGGPFVFGKDFTTVDAKLAPALYHLRVALKHFKNWSIPSEFSHVINYVQALDARESFQKTKAPESVVIAGWSRALGVAS